MFSQLAADAVDDATAPTAHTRSMLTDSMVGLFIALLMRRTGFLARNTIRSALRSEAPPGFRCPERPSKLDPFKEVLLSPVLDHDLGLGEGAELLDVQQLVSNAAVSTWLTSRGPCHRPVGVGRRVLSRLFPCRRRHVDLSKEAQDVLWGMGRCL
jgi:hypothetical protein